MTDAESAVTLVRRYYAHFNARQFTRAAALLTSDCEFSHTATRDRAHGHRGYRVLIDDWMRAAPDVTITPESMTALDDDHVSVRVCLRGHFQGEFTLGGSVIAGTGQPFALRGFHRLRVRDGLIASSEFSFDPADLIRLG